MRTLLSYLIPQTVFETSSNINAKIVVQDINGHRNVIVNGIQQTGAYVESIFFKGFRSFHLLELPNIQNILVLGIGGGYVIKTLLHAYPDARITAVDIDQKIIDIATHYFALPSSTRLTYICKNAESFVKQSGKNSLFDLIIVDLYIGDDVPDFLQKPPFYNDLRQRLTAQGHVFINYQGTKRYDDSRKALEQFLPTLFSCENHMRIKRNQVFFLQK